MKLIWIIIYYLLVWAIPGNAQLKYVKLGVDGLTCTACCRSVEKFIGKLKNVKEVSINLDNAEGVVYFVNNENVNFESISRAVTRAGFSIRFINVVYQFSELQVNNDFCLNAGAFQLQFVRIDKKILDGLVELKLLGEKFQTKSEFRKIKSSLVNLCGQLSISTYFVSL